MAKSSRSRARERKKEREKQQQRNRQLLVVGGIIGVVVVLALLVIISNLPADAPIPEGVAGRYDNYMTSTTTEGYPRLGNPDAPVSVVEYGSFSCAGCANFHSTAFEQLLPRIESGQMNFVYVPLQTGSVPNAEGAARTAICAGEQGAFWEMHDVLFDWHVDFGNNAFAGNRLTSGVDALGLDTGAFNNCFNSQQTNTVLQTALQEGVGATPSVTVNGTTVDANAASILAAVDGIAPANGNYESGLLNVDDTDATEETTEEEPVVEETEVATEEPMAETEAVSSEETTEEPAAESTEDN